jgi:predicted esterase
MQRIALMVLAACLLSVQALADGPRTGLYTTSFTETTPLAEQREVAQRMLHRIVYEQDLAQGSLPSGQSIDPAKESWHVYVPDGYTGSEPYGVLVWVAPYDSGEIAYGWQGQLSDHKLIYVAADKSGNDQGVMDRRVPLALTGLANIEAQYKVDPARIYVGGFSGGGVTASRIAAAYSDVFTGGLFVSTSEGIGSENTPVPPLERYTQMKQRGRYVFTIGTEETNNQVMTGRAVDEYRSLCVLRVEFIHIPNRGHANLEPRVFARALKYLDDPPGVSASDQADCDKELEARRGMAIDAVRQALAAGDKDKAHGLLLDLHQSFGPLAEPEFSHYAACVNGNSKADDCQGAKASGGG